MVAKGNGEDTERQDAWVKCDGCAEILYRKELARTAFVCPLCNHHFRVGSAEFIELLTDPGTFEERHASLRSADPLGFADTKKYSERLKQTRKKVTVSEAVVVGFATTGGHRVGWGFMDFSFMGGSMGSVVGERIARIIGDAIEARAAVAILSASGGARMQEGVLSLMQMAKTSAMLGKLREARLPYVSILTHPTTGGVTASYSTLGDVILAEPNALIGFAGPRVIRETINQELPEGFQKSEFLLRHGLVDRVVDRRAMKETLVRILDFFSAARTGVEARSNNHDDGKAPSAT
jgi:acetyl-CoA carboxylase carboxyl transferase subunit beta